MTKKSINQMLVSVTLNYYDWWELLEAAEEAVLSEAQKPHCLARKAAEQMLPLLKAHTQVCKQSEKDEGCFQHNFQLVYREMLSLFNPRMCPETKERYEKALASGDIVLLEQAPEEK